MPPAHYTARLEQHLPVRSRLFVARGGSRRLGGRALASRRTTLLGLLALTVSACSAIPPNTTTGTGQKGIIKVGLGAPFSGYDGETAQQLLDGVRLAVVERNASGGVNGYGVQLVSFDDEMSPAVAERRARELVLDPQVIAVVGHVVAGTAAAARPAYERGGLPFVSLAPGESAGQTFRLLPTDAELAAYVVDELGQVVSGRRAAVVIVDTAGFRRVAEAFSATLRQQGWSLVAQPTISDRSARFADVVLSLVPNPPDLVVFAGLPDQGTAFAEELAQQLPSTWFIGVATADAPQWSQVSSSRLLKLELDWRPPAGDFMARFQSATGRSANAYAALAYDATRLVLDAATGAPTRDGVAATLARGATVDGRLPLGAAWPANPIKVSPTS